jgi:hypothetical protein
MARTRGGIGTSMRMRTAKDCGCTGFISNYDDYQKWRSMMVERRQLRKVSANLVALRDMRPRLKKKTEGSE